MMLYGTVRGLLRLGLRGWFREVEVHGRENVPADGPLVMIANHHNGMIDPFLLIAASDRPVTFVAKAALFRVPVLGWILKALHCMPAYRGEERDYSKDKNQALFEAAAALLAEGRALGIFPEGKSHLDPKLHDFKHGASRIAFDAQAKGAPVRVAFVGIHFERTRGFRGKALVQFGPTVGLDAHRERYSQDPRAATAALSEELHGRLSEMILTAESRELVRLADLVERMGVLDEGEPGLKAGFERKKALLEGYATVRERAPEDVAQLEEDLRHYRRFLDALGVRDDQVAHDYRFGHVLAYALRNTLLLAFGLPLVIVGLACNLAPYLIALGCAKLGRSLDVRTSIGFLVAAVAFPLTWAALGFGGWMLARGWGLAAALAAAPLSGAVALRWMDQWHRVIQSTWGLWTAIALPAARAKLRRMRARIIARVEKLIALWRSAP